MTDRTVSVRLKAEVAGFVAGFRTAGRSAKQFSDRMLTSAVKNRQNLDSLAHSVGLVGAAMTGLAVVAVREFAEFDAKMSQVQALSHATAAEMEQLRQAALHMGQGIGFSATEVADAETELVKAGVAVKDIMGGALKGALDLAAAGQINVADATEIAAVAMTQFKLSGKDVPHLADLLAAGADKALGGVDQLGMALKQSGLVAAQFGLSVEDTIGTLAEFAQAGLLGSDAGTSFKQMLLQLASPTAKAQNLMHKLGLSAYDAQGNFIGITALAGQLHDRLADIPQAQRNAALSIIFGSDAIRAANVLYEDGAKGSRKWIDGVYDSGFAAQQASAKMDNLSGDLKKLQAALQAALIGAGEGADSSLRPLVQGLTDVVTEFGNLPPAAKTALLAITGGGGLVLLGTAGMAKLIGSVGEARRTLVELGITGRHVAGALKFAGVAAGATAAYVAIDRLTDLVRENLSSRAVDDVDGLEKSLIRLGRTGKSTGEFLDTFGRGAEGSRKSVHGLGIEVQFIGKTWAEAAKIATENPLLARFQNLGDTRKGLNEVRENVEKVDKAIAEAAKSGHAAEAAKAYQILARQARGVGLSSAQVAEILPRAAKAIRTAGDDAGYAETGVSELGTVMDDTAGDVKDLRKEMDRLVDTIGDLIDKNLDAEGAALAFRDQLRSMSKAVKENGTSFAENTAKGDANRQMLLDGVQAAKAHADAVRDQTKKTQGAAAADLAWQSTMRGDINRLRDAFRQLGFNRDQTDRYIAKILGIPKSRVTHFSAPGLDHAAERAQFLQNKLDYLNGKKFQTTYIRREITIQETRQVGNVSGGNIGRRAFPNGATGGLVDAGKIRPMAAGGPVRGPGTGTSDTAGLFALSNGEFVVNAVATKRFLPMLKAMNSGAAQAATGEQQTLTGELYLDSGQFLGTVRGVVSEDRRQLKRRAVGMGAR